MKRRKHQKLREIYINELINIIENNKEYQQFLETNKRYKKFVEEKQKLKIWGSIIYDTFDNKAMNKLIKSFDKLSPQKYEVSLNYRAKKFKDLNYYNLQYEHSSISTLGTIKFSDDKYIKEISASFTQVNNNQAVVEFDIDFNKIMDDKMFFDFIKDNKELLINKSFIGYYDIKKMMTSLDYSDIYRQFDELVKLALQAKLMEVADLNYGVDYKLPLMMIINYPKSQNDEKLFRNVFLCETYEIRNGDQYLITDITSHEGLQMDLYFSGNSLSPVSFTHMLSNYRMDFYYFLFDGIEQIELNQRMNRYFNESQDNISSKDYKWLVNKVRAINDNKLHLSYDKPAKKEMEDWKAFYNGEERDLYFTNKKYIQKYETIYTECLEHIKILYAVGKENLIIKVASWTLVATLIGILLTIMNML
ncbi:hypothetical protein [Bacillus paranthracis]|uniref:hypothetical protein n=1 Tax=Bacillus paranthracis TaxID=2026186 RepID=UPI003CF37A08